MGAGFRGGEASIPRGGINILMTDRVQWLDAQKAYTHVLLWN